MLEHSRNPRRFLEEMQRVAKGGYIEMPDAFMERINPYPDHRLEINVRQGWLIIRKKREWQIDPDVVELYEDRVKEIITKQVIPAHPFVFHIRYYWQDEINFKIINPEVEMMPHSIDQQKAISRKITMKEAVHTKLLTTIRRLFSQHQRNAKIDLVKLLRCPDCHFSELYSEGDAVVCSHCGRSYLLRKGIPDMTVMQESK